MKDMCSCLLITYSKIQEILLTACVCLGKLKLLLKKDYTNNLRQV